MTTTPEADLHHILEFAPWADLRGMRLFLTGGTGFFGRWLLDSLAFANDHAGLAATAVVLTRDPAAFARKAPRLANRADLTFVAGDVRDFAFPAGQFSHVLHAATEASSTLNETQPLEMLDAVIAGTRRVLEFSAKCGASRFLLTSSGAVYGRQPSEATHLPENYAGAPDPTDPRAAYGEGKRVAEAMTCMMARRHGFTASLARCFAFVGPHLPRDGHFAVGNFLGDALAGRPIRVAGDGTPVRSYLHAADLTVWLWSLLTAGPNCQAVNVGSDEAISIGELARRVGALADVEVQVAQLPTPGLAAARYVPDIAKARSLGLEIRIGLDDALRRTFGTLRRPPAVKDQTRVSAGAL